MYRVAVYGTLRMGELNHRLLESSQYIGMRNLDGFLMRSLGNFPTLVEGDGQVTVEVYEVDEETFILLDRLEGFPRLYQRKEVVIDGFPAWIYYWKYAESAAGYPLVECGDWVRYQDSRRPRAVY